MSIITRGLDPINSRLILQGYYDYQVHVQVIEREIPRQGGGSIPIGFPSARQYERDIILKIKREDEDEWKTFFIEDVDAHTDVLYAKVIGIIGDEEKTEKITFHITEQVSKGEKDFKFSVKEVL